MNDIRRNNIDTGALFAGVVLIGIGVLFFLDRMDIADFGDIIRRGWPLLVVFAGISRLLRGDTWSALSTMVVGAWLLVANLRLFGLSFGNSWPLLLISLGALMVVRAIFEAATRRERSSPEEHHER